MALVLWPFRLIIHYLRNLWRRTRRPPQYVFMVLAGSLPDIDEPKGSWWQRFMSKRPLSMQELAVRFERIAGHRAIRGVVLHLRDLDLPASRVQALQGLIDDLRRQGKEVVVWSTRYKRQSYQVALHADRILMQEGGSIGVLGLTSSHVYIGDSLAWAGLKVEPIQISPYKSAQDRFARSDMSQEVREMNNWILDSHYRELKQDICLGRKVTEQRAEEIINKSPYVYTRALDEGLVDGIVSEEDLPEYLITGDKPATVVSWPRAERALQLVPLCPPGEYIGVIKVTGSIVDGTSDKPSFKPPLPIPYLFSERAGDITVVAQARAALQDTRVKGVLLYVDSGGGSATASEAMYAALAKVAAKKPVVAMMGSKAASGGYYVTTAAQWVVAQPGTITGSIGVLTGKLVDGPLLKRLLANRIEFSRGDSAGLETSERPYTESERQVEWERISSIYELFLRRVAQARKTTPEAIDRIGGGRVWTGRLAREHGLVDELGGLKEAVAKIRDLAGLSERVGLREVPGTSIQAPVPIQAEASALAYGMENIRLLNEARILCVCPVTLEE